MRVEGTYVIMVVPRVWKKRAMKATAAAMAAPRRPKQEIHAAKKARVSKKRVSSMKTQVKRHM
jgi:hypothetical protein